MDPRSRGFTPAQSYPGRPYDYDPLPYPTPPSVGTIHSLPPAPPALDSPGYHSYLHHHSNAPPLVLHHGNPEQQKIKTLFISGLPDDVKAREIHNLFRHHRGFSSCQLKYTGRGNEVVAFAMFINHQSAIAALGALNGTIFDPETRAVIHIELARSNSRKRPRGGAAYWIIDKRTKFHKEATEEWSDEGDGGSDEPSGTENDSPSNKRALAASRRFKCTLKCTFLIGEPP
ncbi:hypothetical protein HPP92_004884 [Vanilla planifolia]|uniref:RRM domain-containing protein n=1 Tax=Vanilla planifolia TaxID=51239 RepID=A0A835RT07_VANPL|nr:hypothetical protein HPP92_004884 [Vanilla planifolia]